jgi:FtsH-binding integral membrane protein
MNKRVLSNTFIWLFIGLLITFTTAYLVSNNAQMVLNIFSGWPYYLLIILELGIAVFLSVRIWKLNGITATCLYIFYTFLTGLTLSSIFLVYKLSSLIFIFLVAAVLFLIFGLIGKFTKIDLSKISTFLVMGLIGVILINIINMFLMNNTLNIISCIIGLVVFFGYTAYDIQKIKQISYGLEEDNAAIFGAFELYIDFINLFLRLLQFFGKERD